MDKAILVAEVGQNGCGDIKLNKKLIKLAKQNGADAVKFQLYDTEALYPPDSPTKQQAKEAELSFWQAKELFLYGTLDQKIEVFFSVFDVERVRWAEQIGVQRYKIAYSQNGNEELAAAVLATGKPAIVSSKGYLKKFSEDTTTLYCVPNYPADIADVDFKMLSYHDGYSDHVIGLEAAKIALAQGTTIIEKHFCLRHDLGVDALWSMTPDELVELVRWRNICQSVS